MTVQLEGAAIGDLLRALESCSITFPGIRVVCDTLPGKAICAATISDGVLWLVLDLDKPSAPRHALAMIREAKDALCADEQLLIPPPRPVSRAPLALAG